MRNFRLGLLFIATAGWFGLDAAAQLSGPGQTGMNAAMTKLFGDITYFSSRAEVRLFDKGQKESMSMMMNFALLNGMMRAEIDLSQIKSAELPPQTIASFKQVGLDKLCTIIRPDLKSTWVVYPSLQAYAGVPMPKEEVAELEKKYTVTKQKMGKETVESHPCEKAKVLVTGDKGEKNEALVWYASDLKNFPVKMQMAQEGSTVVIVYRDVRLEKPDAKAFEAPTGYTKYDSVEKMMAAAMSKLMGGQK